MKLQLCTEFRGRAIAIIKWNALAEDARSQPMQGATKERWQELCEQATTEQDPDKLLVLIAEINRLLEEKDQRLRPGRNDEGGADR